MLQARAPQLLAIVTFIAWQNVGWGQGGHAPSRPPLTPDEARYLLDREEIKQSEEFRPTPRDVEAHSLGPTPPVDAQLLTPELLRIQRAVGGSVIEQFEGLSPSPGSPAPSPAMPSPERKAAVNALREAAWQLDTAAHRLESLELFRQADALREQARQLRLDARSMMGCPQPEPHADRAAPPAPALAPPSGGLGQQIPSPSALERVGPVPVPEGSSQPSPRVEPAGPEPTLAEPNELEPPRR